MSQAKRDSSLPQLTIRLLGRFEVLRDRAPISQDDWGRRKTETLLKVLLTEPGTVFSQDQLVEILFGGEDPQRALHNLHCRVSELRRALEPGLSRGTDSAFVLRRGQGYLFNTDSHAWIDVVSFQDGVQAAFATAEAKDWMAATDQFETALALYRDELLSEDRYEEWAEGARSQLRELHLDALSQLANACEQLGRIRQAISCCQRILHAEPHREAVIRQLMTYQQEAGYRAQALETYRQGERALREYLNVEPSTETRALRDKITRQRGEEPSFDARRIAVLPLQNYSPDAEDEYIADGMTEELIGWIAKVKDLRVVARTSVMRFKGTTKPVAQIARDLNVGTILEGSVRKIGERIRISAQLIDAATEDHLWAEHYDLDLGDVLEVQGQIARRASEALKLKLLSGEGAALREAEAGDSDAHIAYLKGRHFLEKPTREALERAMGYFKEALRREPEHARALTGLADVCCRMVQYATAEEGYTKARAYVERALTIDDSLAEAYTSLARITWGHERNFEEAERLLRRAIQLDPNYALAHARFASLLASTDRTDEAIEASKVALALDPLSASLSMLHAHCLYTAARFHEAIEQAKKAIELDPVLDDAWWVLWYSFGSTWDWDQAEAVLREMVAKYPENPHGYVYLAMCVQCRGRLEEGVALMEKALALPEATEGITVLFYCGNGYYFAREYDQAERYYRKVLERIPAHEGARVLLAKCHLQRQRFDEALAELDAAENTYGLTGEYWLSHVRMERGRIYALRGEIEKAEAELALLMDGATRQNRRLCVAVLLHVLGRVEESLEWAEDAVDAREPHVNAIRKMPCIPHAMWEHSRFQALLKRVGLAD